MPNRKNSDKKRNKRVPFFINPVCIYHRLQKVLRMLDIRSDNYGFLVIISFLLSCVGERDRVKCWYCNGGMQNWERNDIPWEEHAKWFPM